ncbi:MAG: acetate--CoA ligase family protein, partial [Burkholderiaceae bacterium]|nr:acetate--CoA ligase family protein [Burkholderiaceae bacterium]
LGQVEARQVLSAYGVRMPAEELSNSVEQACQAAGRMGWPVVLKIVSPDIPHKTEAGGVELHLGSAAAVEAAYGRILANAKRHVPDARIEGIQVQKMQPPGREMVVGIVNDPDFGPLVMLGFGGIYVEVLRDVVFALAPLDLNDAHDMIQRLKGKALLEGVRGEAASDVAALAQLLVGVSNLVASNPGRISEIDLNPVMLYPVGQGAIAVDALVLIEAEKNPALGVSPETKILQNRRN